MAERIPNTVVDQSAALAFQIGVCLGKIARFAEAERHLKIAIELSPQNAMYHANLGVLYQRWARYDLAENSYIQALLDRLQRRNRSNGIYGQFRKSLTGPDRVIGPTHICNSPPIQSFH
ncbi:tetratricopeptide repeat protein [Cooperia oncophora]